MKLKNLFKSQKIIFFTLASLSFVFFVCFLIASYQGFETKVGIKLFGSRGILLYLVFWLVLYTSIIFSFLESKQKRLCFIVIGLLISIAMGICFSDFSNPTVGKILSFPAKKTIQLNPYQDRLVIQSRFTNLPEQFKGYLHEVEEGRLRLFVKPFFFSISKFNSTAIQLFDFEQDQYNRFVIPKTFIKNFLEKPQLRFKINPDALEDKTYSVGIYSRDYRVRVQSRQDTILLNAKQIDIPDDGIMLIAFYFEQPDGRPRVVFH